MKVADLLGKDRSTVRCFQSRRNADGEIPRAYRPALKQALLEKGVLIRWCDFAWHPEGEFGTVTHLTSEAPSGARSLSLRPDSAGGQVPDHGRGQATGPLSVEVGE